LRILNESEWLKLYTKHKRKRIAGGVLLLLLTLVTVYILYTAYDIYSFGNKDEMVLADAAIILGAEVWDNQPSPVFRERINHGIWLYQNGFVGYLILTGGVGRGNVFSDAFIAGEYVLREGVREDRILLEEYSTITEENISYAASIVAERNLSTVIIVSDPLHMRRSMLMAENYGLHAYSSPTPTTKYQSLRTQLPFLARETFLLVGYRLLNFVK